MRIEGLLPAFLLFALIASLMGGCASLNLLRDEPPPMSLTAYVHLSRAAIEHFDMVEAATCRGKGQADRVACASAQTFRAELAPLDTAMLQDYERAADAAELRATLDKIIAILTQVLKAAGRAYGVPLP